MPTRHGRNVVKSQRKHRSEPSRELCSYTGLVRPSKNHPESMKREKSQNRLSSRGLMVRTHYSTSESDDEPSKIPFRASFSSLVLCVLVLLSLISYSIFEITWNLYRTCIAQLFTCYVKVSAFSDRLSSVSRLYNFFNFKLSRLLLKVPLLEFVDFFSLETLTLKIS